MTTIDTITRAREIVAQSVDLAAHLVAGRWGAAQDVAEDIQDTAQRIANVVEEQAVQAWMSDHDAPSDIGREYDLETLLDDERDEKANR